VPSQAAATQSQDSARAPRRASTERAARPSHPPRDTREPAREASRPTAATPARRRVAKRSRSGSPYGTAPRLTSQRTDRAAYAETRQWLLEQHGPVCAYCGGRFEARGMTLDHVAPRRGQTAYDRRDNLVLACPACNTAKRDLAPIAFLLARRSRAANLLRYGSHLSPMLVELARSLVPPGTVLGASDDAGPEPYDADDDSPYRD